MKKGKIIISLGLATVMGISLIEGVGEFNPIRSNTFSDIIIDSVQAKGTDYGLSNPKIAYNTRDCIEFGSYWQEDTNGDGKVDKTDDKQPIKWQILSKNGSDVFLLSDKVLDEYPYYKGTDVIDDEGFTSTDYTCTWETSDVRKWLNSDFINSAFTDSERSGIIETTLNNYSYYGNKDEGNTTDKVFLLSLSDIENTGYRFGNSQVVYDQARMALPTEFVKQNKSIHYIDGGVNWWLRTSSNLQADNKFSVDYNGGTSLHDYVNNNCGIRPAIHLNLSAINGLYKEAGTVNVSVKGAEYDTVVFGNYDDKKLVWRVLNVNGNDAFLLADKDVAYKKYNDEDNLVKWIDSSLRSWLNNEFYNKAFSYSEKLMITTMDVTNEDYPYKNTSDSYVTTENVYLLSLYDMINPSFGFPNVYGCECEIRSNGSNMWWLRSYGKDDVYLAYNTFRGVVDFNVLHQDFGSVRPVLHIDLSASAWTKGDKKIIGEVNGAVCVEGPSEKAVRSATQYNPPTEAPTQAPAPKPTTTPTQVPSSVPTVKPTSDSSVSPTPSTAVVNDNKTTFSIKNKAKIKKTAKIKVKDKDKIKKITLNGKKIKIKKNKTSITIKLKSYKKALKKKGKWNVLKVTDNNGNVKLIKFKTR